MDTERALQRVVQQSGEGGQEGDGDAHEQKAGTRSWHCRK